MSEIVHTVVEHAKRTGELIGEFYGNLANAFVERILPALNTALTNIEAIITNVYEETQNVVLAVVERGIKALQHFEPDFAKIGKPLADFAKQLTDIVDKYFQWAHNEYTELYKLLSESLRELPGIEFVQDKLKEVSDASCVYIELGILFEKSINCLRYLEI